MGKGEYDGMVGGPIFKLIDGSVIIGLSRPSGHEGVSGRCEQLRGIAGRCGNGGKNLMFLCPSPMAPAGEMSQPRKELDLDHR
ncbi:hypothetical protein O5O45_26465 [Hahella aquimaris]|uniref:hypothetical protein n=1 Tax=Hahella sp. HNIBRBA332 TaxID=3015983 RepID=UPI00273AF514|nr:hypothetical protein [Hahella sp. HNIBRBA332]WLQ13275.1 hypothetical protein O5O45_26465 [Hahella sp. HNIBRBA332]